MCSVLPSTLLISHNMHSPKPHQMFLCIGIIHCAKIVLQRVEFSGADGFVYLGSSPHTYSLQHSDPWQAGADTDSHPGIPPVWEDAVAASFMASLRLLRYHKQNSAHQLMRPIVYFTYLTDKIVLWSIYPQLNSSSKEAPSSSRHTIRLTLVNSGSDPLIRFHTNPSFTRKKSPNSVRPNFIRCFWICSWNRCRFFLGLATDRPWDFKQIL